MCELLRIALSFGLLLANDESNLLSIVPYTMPGSVRAHNQSPRNRLPNAFAFLSPDIIFDVLQDAHFERLRQKFNYHLLHRLGGRWGEMAASYKEYTVQEDRLWQSNAFGKHDNVRSGDVEFVNRFIYDINLDDIKKVVELAPKAFEWLGMNTHKRNYYTPWVEVKPLFDTLGSLFTTIEWRAGQMSQYEGEVDFLKRQLRSPHLRILKCDSPLLSRDEFTDLLIDFVRKKNFEILDFYKESNHDAACLSGRVFQAAYGAWLERGDGEHLKSAVSAKISADDLREIIANSRNGERREVWGTVHYSENHPNADHYKMLMSYAAKAVDRCKLAMEFSCKPTI